MANDVTNWPGNLRPISPRVRRSILFFWLACAAFALFAQAGAAWRFGIYQFEVNPAFASLGLYADPRLVETESWSVLQITSGPNEKPARGRIRSINGVNLTSQSASSGARAVRASPDAPKTLIFDSPVDRTIVLVASVKNRNAVFRHQQRWHSIVTFVVDVVLALFFLGIATFLVMRGRVDPLAYLLAFALAFMATLGCWRLWLWLGITWIEPLLNVMWITLLLVALPAMPDGRYLYRWAKWLGLLGPAAAASLYLRSNPLEQTITVMVLAAAMLAPVVLRFLATHPGTERQQMKWVLLGLGAGILLWLPGGAIELFLWNGLSDLSKLLIDVFRRLGLVILAVSLLFSQLKFRLNDADAAIGRAITYILPSAIVAAVWAGGEALARQVTDMLGQAAGTPVAVGLSALLAAILFAPIKARLQSWTARHFQGPLMRLQSVPDRIATWHDGDDPRRLSQRVLAEICSGIGAQFATVMRRAKGVRPAELVASCSLDEGGSIPGHDCSASDIPGTVRLRHELEAADDDLVLLVGPRCDQAPYTRMECAAVQALVEPFSDALNAVSRRAAYRGDVVRALQKICAQTEGDRAQ